MPPLTSDRVPTQPKGQVRVLEAVRGWIERGEVRTGEPLPTMRDVAQTLRVDKGTVCRAMAALQDDGLIRREGRRLHVAGSAPRAAAARGLLSGSILVLTSVQGLHGARRTSSWLGKLIEGLLAAAHDRRCHAMLVHPRSTDEQEFGRLIEGRPMGCVVIATGQSPDEDAAMLVRLRRAGIPVALFGEEIVSDGYDMVTGDHVDGAAQLTRWLAARGCKRVLRYWPYRISRPLRPAWLAHRDEGYELAAKELGLEALPALECARPELMGIEGKAYFDTRVRHAAGYLVEYLTGPGRVDAILTPTDRLAYEAAAACRLFGLEPNRDVLIAGYDGDWEQCPEAQWESAGPIVTIRQDDAALGRRMVEVLLERVADRDAAPRFSVIPSRLIEVERSS